MLGFEPRPLSAGAKPACNLLQAWHGPGIWENWDFSETYTHTQQKQLSSSACQQQAFSPQFIEATYDKVVCMAQAEYMHGIAEAFSSGQLSDESLVGALLSEPLAHNASCHS